jgi:hypothetical protein
LPRAERTATIIMKETGLAGIHLSDELREINLADLEGKSFARATEEDPARMDAFGSNPSAFIPGPGGEKFDEVQKRALNFVLPLFEAHRGEREGFVNYGLSLSSVKFTAFFTERDGRVRISFRSKDEFDVNVFASTYFNGGGHKNASASYHYDSLENTLKYFEEVVKNHPELKNNN